MRTELGLAWAGLRHRPGRWWLLGLGVALAALMPVLAAGLQATSAVAAVTAAVDAVPEGSRGVLAVTSRDVRGPDLDTLDAQVRDGYVAAGLPVPQRVLAFRALALGGVDVTVGALDRLPDDVVLTGGRLPTRCTPAACEVLTVTPPGGTAVPEADDAAHLGLVVTGSGRLREPRLAGLGLVTPGQPLLLGTDPGAMTGLRSLALYGRNLGWLAPLDARVVTARGSTAFADALAAVSAAANLSAGPMNVTWPSDVVLAASGRADAAAPRFAVLGAGAAALQLGFCLVLAAGARRAQRQQGALLGRRGAGPGQVLQVATGQPFLVVLAGLVAGSLVGTVVVAGLTSGVTARPWANAATAVGRAWPTLVALGAAAVLVTVALGAGREVTGRSVRLVLGLGLLGAAGLGVLALVRPGTDPTAPLPVAALVALVLAVGLVAALVWSPVVAAAGPRRRHRLGPVVLLTRRRPLLPSVTAGFLAAALASAVLAGGYAASLQRSAQDRAVAAVPLDVRVTPSAQVPVPGAVLDAAALRALSPEVAVSDVVSAPVTAFAGSIGATALPLTGIDPDVLGSVPRFAAVTGSPVSAAAVTARLRSTPPAGPAPVLPAGARVLRVAVEGLHDDVSLVLWSTGPDGQEQQVPLVRTGPVAVATLDGGPARTVRALEVVESAAHLMHRQHGIGEGSTDRALAAGTLQLGAVSADAAPLAWSWAGWGSDQAQAAATGTGLRAAYRIGDQRVVLVPGWSAPATRAALPVAVDPATAARAGARGTFGITLNGTTQPVRVAVVLPRMPTLPTSFVLADRVAVTTLVDRTAPGTAPVSQVWIRAPGAATGEVRALLGRGPAATATVQYRSDLAAAFAADPVAGGFVRLLGAAGAVALLLSLVALVGGVRADREASAADLFTLELDGVAPRRLRRVLAARAALVLLVGLPVGLLGGVAVAAAGVRLLGAGPDGAPVSPPLRLVLVSWPTGLVVGVAVLGAVAAVLLAARTTVRGRWLEAPEADLR